MAGLVNRVLIPLKDRPATLASHGIQSRLTASVRALSRHALAEWPTGFITLVGYIPNPIDGGGIHRKHRDGTRLEPPTTSCD